MRYVAIVVQRVTINTTVGSTPTRSFSYFSISRFNRRLAYHAICEVQYLNVDEVIRIDLKNVQMRVGLAYRGFRINLKIMYQRKNNL